jgi:hypothetical protein
MLAASITLTMAFTLSLAAGFVDGYAEGADVSGPRPAPEVRRALLLARPALDACVAADARGSLFIDVEILAAGFVDRASVFAAMGTFDEACVLRAVRAMALSDRGMEPRTYVVAHLVAGAPLPHPTPREMGEAMLAAKTDLERCEQIARRGDPALAGSIVLRFRVQDERAHPEVVAGSVTNQALRECVVRSLAGLHVSGAREPVDVVWPVFFARPPPPPPERKAKSVWDAPTLFDFLGCGGAFTT